jgi:hypothetical protein
LKRRALHQITTRPSVGGPVEPFRVHDFRRTVRSGLARLQVPEHLAERMSAHIDDGVRCNCNRYSYLEEKRHAPSRPGPARLREIIG